MKKIIFAFFSIAVFAASAFADVRMPDASPSRSPTPKPQEEVQLRIVLRPQEKQARLVIPREHLKETLAETGLPAPANDTASGFSRAHTVAGGFFLSLAFIAGGVWMARVRKGSAPAGRTIAFGAVLFLAGVFSTIAFANVAPPPPQARSITSRIFDKEALQRRTAYGDVKLEVEEGEGSIYLFVPLLDDEKTSE